VGLRDALATAALAASLAFPAGAGAEPAAARSVAFTGSMGEKALLVIDGTPRTLAVGSSWQGVKLVAMADGEAKVEVDGKPALLRIGAPVSVGRGVVPGAGTVIVMSAGSGGHFTSSGAINGRAVQFLVDTGATTIAMGQADAARIGLNLRDARQGMVQTANGVVPVHHVTLNSVRIGEVEIFNVAATVMPAPMSHILLGNSFLTRFQMKRVNDMLTLEKR
jgi:aspartyl protease family protein